MYFDNPLGPHTWNFFNNPVWIGTYKIHNQRPLFKQLLPERRYRILTLGVLGVNDLFFEKYFGAFIDDF